MRNFILILLGGILFMSCNRNMEYKDFAEKANGSPDQTIALKFINDYVKNCNKFNKSIEITTWTKANPNASDRFKNELVRIVENAFKQEPELGLGFDPIFDAQDYPEEGFNIESLDNKTGYVIVKGKNMGDFKLTMKLIKENNIWLVDGCGIVNIPEEKRIKR